MKKQLLKKLAIVAISMQCATCAAFADNVVFNLSGLSGNEFIVKYTNGEQSSLVLDQNGSGTIESTTTPSRIIYSITSDATGEVLVGREEAGTINLSFENNKLKFRSPNEAGLIPIGSYAELALIDTSTSYYYGKYSQDANIDLLGSADLESAGLERKNWNPIASIESDGEFFTGLYLGNNFELRNLYINRPEEDEVGVFGSILNDTEEFSGIVMVNPQVTAHKIVGSFAGSFGSFSLIANCKVIGGLIYGTDWYTGGFVGFANVSSTVKNIETTCTVVGSEFVGGIFGCNAGSMEYCKHEEGPVRATVQVAGGLVGTSRGLIFQCKNSAIIVAKDVVGGISGAAMGGISQSWNTGDVSAENTYAGGIAGRNSNLTNITGCYNTGTVTGVTYVGGIAGNNNWAYIEACYNTGYVIGQKYVAGICGHNCIANITACYNSGIISGQEMVGGICGQTYGGNIFPSYWLKTPNVEVGIAEDVTEEPEEGQEADVFYRSTFAFSETNWPGVGKAPLDSEWKDLYWWYNDGSEEPSPEKGNYWKSFGKYVPGGEIEGMNSSFPRLWWEDVDPVPPAGVDDIDQVSKIKIYPNPATDYICIDSEYDNAQIFTIDGTKVKEQQSGTIDISNLRQGVYLIMISADNKVYSQKIIVK